MPACNYKIVLHPSKARHTISRHIYGHFAEHLGWGIYGGFIVPENLRSLVPNVEGIRMDVIDDLKQLGIPNLRWPGGCFADTYHWKDGVGPIDQRPSIVNTWWGHTTEDNSFGTDEFLKLCKLLGAEPFISANVGSGTVQELTEWVQYVNFEGASPMSDWRRRNGRDLPWNVKYWGLGNEAWGCGGNMRAEFYVDFFRQYSTYMTGWSNNTGLFRIASGAQSADYHWTETLMKLIPPRLMEGLGLHHYAVIDWNNKGPARDFTTEHYMKSVEVALFMDELLRQHSAIMDRYDPERKIALIVDEWGGWYDPEPGTNPGFLYQQNTMRDAIIAGLTLNIFNSHCARLKMANLAQAINVLQAVLLVKDQQVVRTPTYHVMNMYRAHHDAVFVPFEIDTTSAGPRTLSMSCSMDSEEKLHLTMVNWDLNTTLALDVEVGMASYYVKGEILKSARVTDYNSFSNPHTVHPQPLALQQMRGSSIELDIPPFSIVKVSLGKK